MGYALRSHNRVLSERLMYHYLITTAIVSFLPVSPFPTSLNLFIGYVLGPHTPSFKALCLSLTASQSIAAFCIVVFDLSISLSELTALKLEFNRLHRYTSFVKVVY